MMFKRTIGNFEYQILSVLLEKPDGEYGLAISEFVSERSGKDVSIGAIYTTLSRLENKGFVASWWGEATPERGGRRKRYFRVLPEGVSAIRQKELELHRLMAPFGAAAMG